MADLLIPALIRTWFIFLVIFSLLGYAVPFSIVFGFVGGLAGGLIFAWWEIKGGVPAGPKGSLSLHQLRPPTLDNSNKKNRFELPFFKPNQAQRRYIERQKRARARRMNK